MMQCVAKGAPSGVNSADDVSGRRRTGRDWDMLGQLPMGRSGKLSHALHSGTDWLYADTTTAMLVTANLSS